MYIYIFSKVVPYDESIFSTQNCYVFFLVHFRVENEDPRSILLVVQTNVRNSVNQKTWHMKNINFIIITVYQGRI